MSLKRPRKKTAPRAGRAFAACLTACLAFGNAASAYGQSARGAEARRPAAAPFKTVGEPFLVLESGAPQTATAQTPAGQSPAQRDAQRPPGTERQSPAPPQSRPGTTDPRTPPEAQRPAPAAPPGTQSPQNPRTDTPQTQDPARPGEPTPAASPEAQDAQPEPNFPVLQARPVPPLPSLSRVGVTSGDSLSLSLTEAIRRALENNNDIEVARADVRLAESFLNSLQGVYDPVFQVTPQFSNSVRPQASTLGGADNSGTVSTTDFSVNNSLVRRVEFWGGSYDVFFNNNRRNTSFAFNTLNPVYSATLGVSYTQPLWRDRAIDNSRRLIRIQRKRLQQSDADFRRRTTEVISQVQRAYWDLVFAIRDEQNQVANINLARENFRRTEASVAAGAVAPIQRAEVQTELSNRESALLLASQQVTFAENTLKNLMLKDPLDSVWTKALVPTDEVRTDAQPVSLQDALTEARANRPEMRRLSLQGEVNAVDLEYFENQTKPRVDVTGTFSTNGLAGSAVSPGVPDEFVGGYPKTLANLLKLKTRDVVVGVTIQLPLRNRTARANLATARIERDQLAALTRSQDQAIEVEVRNAVQLVETSRRRVITARQARESAEEQLAGERRLYQVGRSTTFLLFQRENALVNARNQELRAETDYNIAVAELQRATSTTLRANNVLVESPVEGDFRD